MNLLSFSLADKIANQLPDIMRSHCDMWCDRSGFEIYDPAQFKLTVKMHDGAIKIDRLLIKRDHSLDTARKIVDTVIKAVTQSDMYFLDTTARPDISTKELEQGFMAVTNLDSVATDHPDHLIATV